MLQYIFWAIVFYLLFRFVVNFVVPVIRVGRQMRRQMNQFNDAVRRQQEQQQQQSSYSRPGEANRPSNNARGSKEEDYIDFEEIK